MKLSTVYKRAAALVLNPDVPYNAYFGAIERAARGAKVQAAAEQFADPYAMNGAAGVPQVMTREERSLLFCFLAQLAGTREAL